MGLVPRYKTVTVATAGTAVPVLSGTDQQYNVIEAILYSTATAFAGDATVKASTSTGIPVPTTTLRISSGGKHAIDLSKLYVDATVNGATVNVLYFIKV